MLGKKSFSPRQTRFLPVKKKSNECPSRQKEGVKKTEKSVRENIVLPVKNPNSPKKRGFPGTFEFHGKKITIALKYLAKA